MISAALGALGCLVVLTLVCFLVAGGFFSRRAGFFAAGVEAAAAVAAFLIAYTHNGMGWAVVIMIAAITAAAFCALMGFAAGEN